MTYNNNKNEETATLTWSVRLTLQTEEGDEVSVKKNLGEKYVKRRKARGRENGRSVRKGDVCM